MRRTAQVMWACFSLCDLCLACTAPERLAQIFFLIASLAFLFAAMKVGDLPKE